MCIEEVYHHPEDYDLELHARDVRDLPFWLDLVHIVEPKSVLEVGCGTGRLTLPLARDGVERHYTVTGIDAEPPMLERALVRRGAEAPEVQDALTLLAGDIRTVDLGTVFDAVLMPFGAAHHLLSLDDQLLALRNVRKHLRLGGVFSLDVDAPNMAVLHRLVKGTPRRRDLTAKNPGGQQLERTVASRYSSALQRATHEYEYSGIDSDATRRRYTSTFEMHVYFPRELELLCLATGFQVERFVGSYEGEAFNDHSAQMILVARASPS